VSSPFDLDAYLERIGYTGPRTATLETLEALHALHPAAIPFENLNPLLGWPVALDVESLQAKLVAGGRGGWCYEHNTLFRHALDALGFSVTSLGARVLWNTPPGSPVGARHHMLLLVDLGGTLYIADVGFGGNVLTAPLRLEPHILQPTPHELHRLSPLDDGFILEASLNGEWRPFIPLHAGGPVSGRLRSLQLVFRPTSQFLLPPDVNQRTRDSGRPLCATQQRARDPSQERNGKAPSRQRRSPPILFGSGYGTPIA